MKFSAISIAVACSLPFASAEGSLRQKRSLAIAAGCPGATEDFSLTVRNGCTHAEFRDELAEQIDSATCNSSADDILIEALGLDAAATTADLEDAVRAACIAGYDSAPKFTFQDITQKGEQFNEEYFAGGTKWNYEVETNDGDNVLKYDAQRIGLIRNNEAEETVIPLPTELKSFDPDQDGCDLNAAFCCWVKDRQANDNNGNCATPYDSNCIDKDPADNANLCYVDHSRSPESSHVSGGFTVFGDLQTGKENIEGAIHCHGFAWAEDELDASNAYKGNNLYFVSLFDHMYTRGYVKNVPGSPMCGCAENMAVVTRADCTEIQEKVDFTFTYSAATTSASVSVETIDLNFNSCDGANNNNNDLEAYYERLVDEGRASAANFETLKKTLVGDDAGQCNAAILSFLDTQGIQLSTE